MSEQKPMKLRDKNATLVEYDQAGHLQCSYSNLDGAPISIRKPLAQKSLWEQLLDIFLPAGYPASVTDDYAAYQLYDSLQAFSSSIAGMLSSRAVLIGVGVGDSKAHPTTALLLSVFQESFGRIITILFAHRLGSALEPECKMYRLAADVFNDASMVLDCLSPAFPKPTRVVLFSIASMLRALCGVAAGSSKATLSAHFATKGNLGDVNAKDSSQETVISLLGMLAGSFVVSWISEPVPSFLLLLLLLSIHLCMNYAAVRAVKMHTLNRQRANLLFTNLLAYDKVLTPAQVSTHERIFERDGVLRWTNGQKIGYARIGVSLKALVDRAAVSPGNVSTNTTTAPQKSKQSLDMAHLAQVYTAEPYILWAARTGPRVHVDIVLKQGCSTTDQIKAWLQAVVIAKYVHERITNVGPSMGGDDIHLVSTSLAQTNKVFDEFCRRLQAVGWDLDNAALETTCGPRIAVLDKSD
ncbi:DUF647-domain-containing protein [Microthyrium microscopicum]|uniref:DUF647-domain-containing protein n=1 Tax=Microthyrium microscopicum TaxID=703497 RepID=A0A6A6U029_9PEZI|nr:DUF647-domain-containing protein [Microthyrium microscopicum]